MSYSAMSTKITGDLVDAADWNKIGTNFAAGVPDILSAAGDIPYATAADAATRLGIGTRYQVLRTNTGASAPEWAALPIGAYIDSILALPGLRGLWTMASVDNAGSVYDRSGQARTLTYAGNPTFNVHASGAPYVDLDGTGDWLSRADEAGLDITGTEATIAAAINGLTLGIWFKIDTGSIGWDTLIGKWNTAGNQRSYIIYTIDILGTKYIYAAISNNGAAASSSDYDWASNGVTENAWHFAVLRFVPSTSTDLFYDGAKTTGAYPKASIYSGSSPFAIGVEGDLASYPMSGNASLAFLCAASLSDAQLTGLYQWGRAYYGV